MPARCCWSWLHRSCTRPLTVSEWEEWGNPRDDPRTYAYMKSYSPYENLTATAYPPLLATAALNASRVLPHEPAKWTARLRALSPSTPALRLAAARRAGPFRVSSTKHAATQASTNFAACGSYRYRRCCQAPSLFSCAMDRSRL